MDRYEVEAFLRLAAHAESLRERFPERESVLGRIAQDARARAGGAVLGGLTQDGPRTA
jgi:hypothetical protein